MAPPPNSGERLRLPVRVDKVADSVDNHGQMWTSPTPDGDFRHADVESGGIFRGGLAGRIGSSTGRPRTAGDQGAVRPPSGAARPPAQRARPLGPVHAINTMMTVMTE